MDTCACKVTKMEFELATNNPVEVDSNNVSCRVLIASNDKDNGKDGRVEV